MHKFIEYISDLLFLHDCVILPGFGGFICNYKNARIDESNGTIYPPGKDILFNRNLVQNDGLLINWIAGKEQITYEKALRQVQLFCEELQVRLNQKEHILFGDIGTFYTDRRFNVIFRPSDTNFLAESFGMEGLDSRQFFSGTGRRTTSAYINMDSGNWIHKSLKYGAAAAVIAGIAMITRFGIVHLSDSSALLPITNTSTVQPILPSFPEDVHRHFQKRIAISPDYDYVDYDPWQEQ